MPRYVAKQSSWDLWKPVNTRGVSKLKDHQELGVSMRIPNKGLWKESSFDR